MLPCFQAQCPTQKHVQSTSVKECDVMPSTEQLLSSCRQQEGHLHRLLHIWWMMCLRIAGAAEAISCFSLDNASLRTDKGLRTLQVPPILKVSGGWLEVPRFQVWLTKCCYSKVHLTVLYIEPLH